MLNFKHISRVLVRLFGAINLVSGASCIGGSVLVSAIAVAAGDPGDSLFDGLPFMLLTYGVVYLAIGAGLLLLSEKIAAFASKE